MSTIFKSFFLLLTIGCFQMTTFAQVQIGGDIWGLSYEEQFGYSIDMSDEYTIAIGSPFFRVSQNNWYDAGRVSVYKRQGNSWVQKGTDIVGLDADLLSGASVSMPDSNIVAIGAPNYYKAGFGDYTGEVRIFRWDGQGWYLKGNSIAGESAYDQSGRSVSMPDINTVAIGAAGNDSKGESTGHVRVYSWNSTSWVQKGGDIDGEAAGDRSGWSISMPNNNTVAIGAPYNDVKGESTGHVRVYSWNSTSWVQKGNDIDGEVAGDQFGRSVSMPDANTIAIGAPLNDEVGLSSGHVRVYSWSGSSWVQMGSDIDGEASGDNFGYSVSMPDNNTVAIGAPGNDNSGGNSGHVKVYNWNGVSWVQENFAIEGVSDSIYSAYSVSMATDHILASSAPTLGLVQVHSLCASIDTINVSSCESFTSPSGAYTWTSSGIYDDVLTNSVGCDSVVRVFLTIKSRDIVAISPQACISYLSPSGKYTWRQSGNYKDTLANIDGCDSIIYINLIVDTVNTSVSVSGNSLVADETTATSYQWFDCSNNMTALPGETNRAFIPTDNNSSYAVSIEKNGCIDTSDCISITGLFDYDSKRETIKIYPNPSKGLFTIEFPFTNESKVYTVTDINGKVVREGVINKEKTQLDLSEFVSGIYLLRIEDSIVKLVLN